jgi:uncharacterized repeat protein (TIGR03803 family)
MTRIRNRRRFAIALLAITVASAATSHAQYSVLYSFGVTGGVDAANPIGAIAQGEDGSLYSTAQIGGAPDWGAAYKVTTAGNERLLYSFCSLTNCADGQTPIGGLTLRPDGHFLGTTEFNVQGIAQGNGTIFDISTIGSLTTVYSFTGGTDGANPTASPILGPDGAFYGVTQDGGGPSGCGTIYRLSAVFAVIHTFDKVHGCNASNNPFGALVLGTDGSFYGTTPSGGTANNGVVYKLTYRPGKSTPFAVLANFDSTYGPPIGALVQGSDGNFYGVTAGIQGKVSGSVFKVTPSGGLTTLHALNGTTDGQYPAAGLTFASDGNFYGTAQGGGAHLSGTLFQITPAGSFSVLYNFAGVVGDGFLPTNTVQRTNGLLYGVTTSGGAHEGLNYNCSLNINFGCGVVYSWNGGLPPFVSTVQLMGKVGSSVEILGQGFLSATAVSFNGTPASAKVQSGTSLWATVPAGATTGFVTVTASGGTLTSNRPFIVMP